MSNGPTIKTTLPLKGDAFAHAVARICDRAVPVQPLSDIRHKNILIPGMIGGEVFYALMGFMARALEIRGAHVFTLSCDAMLPACTLRKVDHHESACTRWCYKNAKPFSQAMQLNDHWYSDLITPEEMDACDTIARQTPVESIDNFSYHEVALGEHILRSIESYFKVGHWDRSDRRMTEKAYEFLRSALYLVLIGERALDRFNIDKVVLNDGQKVDWGVLRSVARARGIPVDVIKMGLRDYSIRFEHDRPPQTGLRMPEWETWKHLPLSAQQERALDAYLRRREEVPYEYRSACWHMQKQSSRQLRQTLGLPEHIAGRVFSMFPNVSFDAGKTSTRAAFGTANEWVRHTVDFFRTRPSHHLIVKIHPAEHHRAAQDALLPFLQTHCSPVPTNVHVLPPTSETSAHSVVRISDCVMVYTSTVGVEAAALGKPVVMVGGGWNAQRGFTTDMEAPEQYFELLKVMLDGDILPVKQTELARRYAFSLFFRNNVPLKYYEVLDLNVSALHLTQLADLRPGTDPYVDTICSGILCDCPIEAPDS